MVKSHDNAASWPNHSKEKKKKKKKYNDININFLGSHTFNGAFFPGVSMNYIRECRENVVFINFVYQN